MFFPTFQLSLVFVQQYLPEVNFLYNGSNPGGFGVSAVLPTTGTLTINLNSISISRVLRGSTTIYLYHLNIYREFTT